MSAPFAGIADVAHWDASNVRARGLSLTDALKQAADDGLALLLIKVTQGGDAPQCGTPYVDPEFSNWCNAASAAGIARGFYAVGTDSSDGANQAAFFASTLHKYGFDPATSLCVLDREPNNPAMSPLHAEQWVTAWRAMHNRWPVYYRNLGAVHADYSSVASPSLKSCPAWVAAYKDGAPAVPFWAWQYMGSESSDGEWPDDAIAYPRRFAGLGKVDRSAFNGTREQLLASLATVGA